MTRIEHVSVGWRWRNLWAAVALHWGWNLSNVLAEQLMPAESLSIDAARYLSAAVNLAMLAIVVLLPRPSELRETSVTPD